MEVVIPSLIGLTLVSVIDKRLRRLPMVRVVSSDGPWIAGAVGILYLLGRLPQDQAIVGVAALIAVHLGAMIFRGFIRGYRANDSSG